MATLYNLIEFEKKEMVCLVGAGGKTSTMFCLAQELAKADKKVLVTTTTAIYCPERQLYDYIIVSDRECIDIFYGRYHKNKCITVFGKMLSPEGKLMGVNPKFLDTVFEQGLFDYILVEGDGSKGRPVKSPAEHEPIIPSHTTKLLGLIGIDCIGKVVCSENVHRLEHFCRIAGCEEGDIIDAEMIVRLVCHSQGLFKSAPAQSQKYLILNKADAEYERELAYAIARKLSNIDVPFENNIISSIRSSYFQSALRESEAGG